MNVFLLYIILLFTHKSCINIQLIWFIFNMNFSLHLYTPFSYLTYADDQIFTAAACNWNWHVSLSVLPSGSIIKVNYHSEPKPSTDLQFSYSFGVPCVCLQLPEAVGRTGGDLIGASGTRGRNDHLYAEVQVCGCKEWGPLLKPPKPTVNTGMC